MNAMSRLVSAAAVALALAGCSSYSEIAPWQSTVAKNDGEVPLASFVTQNFSYRLFGFIPLGTGVPWTEGEGLTKERYDVEIFTDKATLDGNLQSLRHALDLVGSHRITQLRTTIDDDWAWSAFVLRRHEIRTQCLILKPTE